MQYPLHINVVFIGFQGDGPFQFKLNTEKVLQGIQAALPEHSPFSFDSKSRLNILSNSIFYYL